jgi:hypothetical protein
VTVTKSAKSRKRQICGGGGVGGKRAGGRREIEPAQVAVADHGGEDFAMICREQIEGASWLR